MQLFYSYSSADESAKRKLEVHLALLKHEGLVETWSFREIGPGDDWQRQIDARLDAADITLLLISANFMASSYCWDIEMKRAIARADAGETMLIPVIVGPCDWKTAPFARFQALPESGKPVSAWRPRDLGWADVASGLRKYLTSRRKSRVSSSAPLDVTHGSRPATPQATVRQNEYADYHYRLSLDSDSASAMMAAQFESLSKELSNIVDELRTSARAAKLSINASERWITVSSSHAEMNIRRSRGLGIRARCAPIEQPPLGVASALARMAFKMISRPSYPDIEWLLTPGVDGNWRWRPAKSTIDPEVEINVVATALMKVFLDFHNDVRIDNRKSKA